MKLLLVFGAFFVFFGAYLAWAERLHESTEAAELGGYFVVTGCVLLVAYALITFFHAPCVLPSER